MKAAPGSMRSIFMTRYVRETAQKPEATYGTYVLAHDADHAQELLTMRCMGEELDSKTLPLFSNTKALTRLDRLYTRLIDTGKRLEEGSDAYPHYVRQVIRLQHAVMHCLELATRSGRYTVRNDMITDLGLLHQLVHLTSLDLVTSVESEPSIKAELTQLTDALPEMFVTAREHQAHQRRSSAVKLVIDCEFNGERGKLISMALVGIHGQQEFYEVVEMPDPVVPWVQENVMPHLHKEPVTMTEFKRRLYRFLKKFPAIHLIADFPADVRYFMDAIEYYKGEWMELSPLDIEVVDELSGKAAKIPHNALEDARAIRDSWLKRENGEDFKD